MANYIYDQDSGELYHYGVKGMKWGVRRSIGTRAKGGAMYSTFIRDVDKKINKLEKRKRDIGLTDTEVKQYKSFERQRDTYTKIRNKLLKDVSPKDIRRGERALKAWGLLGAASAIPMSYTMIKANRILERENNRELNL